MQQNKIFARKNPFDENYNAGWILMDSDDDVNKVENKSKKTVKFAMIESSMSETDINEEAFVPKSVRSSTLT